MISDASAKPAARPEFTSPEIEAARADPDLPNKISRLRDLTSTILDTSGKFTESERVKAYVSAQQMVVTGQLKGMDSADRNLMEQVYRGDIGQKVQRLHQEMSAKAMPLSLAGNGPGAGRAVLAHFDSLSAADQDFLFQTSINAPLRDGKKFASVQAWRDNMNATIQMSEYTWANRDLIASGATSKADDPKFAEAIKLNRTLAVGSPAWSSLVLKLFDRPKDKVDLSDDAKGMVGDIKDTPRSAAQYREGSIASKTV